MLSHQPSAYSQNLQTPPVNHLVPEVPSPTWSLSSSLGYQDLKPVIKKPPGRRLGTVNFNGIYVFIEEYTLNM